MEKLNQFQEFISVMRGVIEDSVPRKTQMETTGEWIDRTEDTDLAYMGKSSFFPEYSAF